MFKRTSLQVSTKVIFIKTSYFGYYLQVSFVSDALYQVGQEILQNDQGVGRSILL